MYAIIETGGKQYKVEAGDVIYIEKLGAEEASEYTFDNKWTDGEIGWYGWYDGLYEYPEYGATGTLQCKFYDENDNLIGVGSVRITD